jgi:mersacidin/lichenicidin family type 2 lantibiotic
MKIDIIKAWKDEAYRSTLTQEQLNTIENPVESLKLSDEQMESVNGGHAGLTVTYKLPNPGPSHSDCCVVF